MWKRYFLAHPAAVGESYLEHMEVAGGFGFRLLGAGLACLVHALIPCLFLTTGSRAIASMHQRMVLGRTARPSGRFSLE